MPRRKKVGPDKDISPDIICAPATPEGSSALALIRVSGDGSFDIVEKIMSIDPGRLKGMRRKLGSITRNGRIIDEVVAFSWPADRSYTGEDMVEITCHGVPGIVREILDTLKEEGARNATGGEFTKRAFLSGRLSAMDIIALASKWQPVDETGSIIGEARKRFEEMHDSISEMKEQLEGDIEFGETHVASDRYLLENRMRGIVGLAERVFEYAKALESSQRVFIMGPVNSGKSTLFNSIVKSGKALVSETPGTTREGTRLNVEIRGRRIELCDTAGTGGEGLDRIAHEAVVNEIAPDDRILWMSARANEEPPETVKEKAADILRIMSKCDLNEDEAGEGMIRVSSLTGEGMVEVREWISQFPGSRSLSGAAEGILGRMKSSLGSLMNGDYGIASEMLGDAERETASILNKGENILISVERALITMCVGK